MSKQAEVLLSRFVLVLIRLSTPLFSRGIQSTPTIRGSTRPASRDNSSEKPRSRSVNAQLSSLPLRQRHQGQGDSTWQLSESFKKSGKAQRQGTNDVRRAHLPRSLLFGQGKFCTACSHFLVPHVALACVASSVPPKCLTILLT
jgi:hypothetical protein